MKKKFVQPIIGISLLLAFLSCGGDNNSNNLSCDKNISFPKKITITTPKLLQKTEIDDNSKENDRYAYIDLQEQISHMEQNKQSFKIDMLLANRLMGEITKRCEDIPIDSTCTIEENQLFFNYNKEVIEEIIQVMGESSREHIMKIKDKKIPLGVVKFTKYNDTEMYQYLLYIEYVPDIKNMTYTKEYIKWSEDEKHISSFYSATNSNFKYDTEVDFLEKDDKSQEMRTKDNFYNKYKDNVSQAMYEFNITKIADEDNHFDFSSSLNTFYNFDGQHSNDISYYNGSLSNQGGTLLCVEKYDNEISKERDTFDADGKIITSIYCSTQSSCDISDESTWSENSEDMLFLGGGKEVSSVSYIEPIGIPLKLTDGNLQNGNYLLLVPQTDITKKSVDDIYALTIGFININGKSIQANLHSKDYKEQLDQLVIVREILTNTSNGDMNVSFELIPQEDKPTLELINE